MRCSTSEVPWISLIRPFTTEIKYEHLCKAEHWFLCSENSAAFVTFSPLFNKVPCASLSGLQQHCGCFHSYGIVLPATHPPFTSKTFLNTPLLSGRFEPTKCFFKWIVYSPWEFDLIYQVALNLFQSEGERRGCYYFTIWKRRYLSSPVQIYNNWFVKIPVAISQQHRKSQRADCSLLHGLCNVPVYSGDTRAVWTHMTFIYGREHNFLQSLSDTEKTTSSFTPFCIKNRKLLTIVFGRRPASFDGNQNGKSHAKWGHAEWTLNPLFTQNGKIIPLMCNSFNASSAKITRGKKKT